MNPHPHTPADRQCLRHAHSGGAPLRNITAVVDPAASIHPCVEKAARLAQASGAILELYACDVVAHRTELLAMLEHLAGELRTRGMEIRVSCDSRVPPERGIARHLEEFRPDLAVKDAHGTNHMLIALIDRPLLLVRPEPWQKYMRITVGADPGGPAQRTVLLDKSLLEFGEVLETALRCDLDVVHVLRTPQNLRGRSDASEEKHRFYAEQRRAVERLVEDRADRGVPLLIEFVEGPVAPAILEFTPRH